MFQHLWTGQRAFLRDMAHKQQRGVLTLRQSLQGSRTFPHLSDGPRCTGEFGIVQGLDAVNDGHIWPQSFEFLQHQLQIRLRQQLQITAVSSEPLPTQLHLLCRFFGTDVEHHTISCNGRCALQQQCALADPRIPPHQHQ